MRTEWWKGAVAGVAGGLAASFIMNQFQAAWMRQVRGFDRGHGAQSAKTEGDHDPTTKVAEAVMQRPLNRREKEVAGRIVHYAYGAATGVAYGALAEIAPGVTIGFGSVMGTAIWLLSDPALLPALGLSRRLDEYPPWIHAYSVASHLVYGVSAEAVRRTVRGQLG